jgi:two-component system response regulator MtrA
MRQRTVLVVEDDPGITALIQALLTEEGYGCVCCPTLAEALTLLAEQRVDLILTDSFSLTGKDVLTSPAALFAARGGAPVVLLTAFRGEVADAHAAGFAALLFKPFEVEELLAQVALLLADAAADARAAG